MIAGEANLLLVKSLQQSDHLDKFKCLANNTYGAHAAESQLRLELAASKLVELEPRSEFINKLVERSQQFVFNCTIRGPSGPLVAIEWLKNGQPLFAISLSQASALQQPQQLAAELANGSSLLDDPNQELSALDFQQAAGGQQAGGPEEQIAAVAMETLAPSPVEDSGWPTTNQAGRNSRGELAAAGNYVATPTSLRRLLAEAELSEGESGGRRARVRQLVRRLGQESDRSILYQLQFDQLRRSDRGSYQCRARTSRTTLHSTGHLVLKDNPPQFVDTFQSQLVGASGGQVSLKCVASGSPLPEIGWSLSGFQVPESSRFRVGDYVTRDGLIVSFVNISSVQVEGELANL